MGPKRYALLFLLPMSALMAAARPVDEAIPSQVMSVDPIQVAAQQPTMPDILARATYPANTSGSLPLIILSHGDRLSRNDYRPLVEAWARAGFMVVQPDHPDASIDGVAPSSRPENLWHKRIQDIEQVLDHLSDIERASGRRIDRNRVVVAGHSLGGLTAEAMIGARITDPATGALASFADPRIKAAILLAPPGGGDDLAPEWKARAPYLAVDFTAMRGPLLVVTGDKDSGPMSTAGTAWRMQAYRRATPGGKCLVVVAGASHYLGGINGVYQPPVDADPMRLALVRQATTSFLLSALYPKNTAWSRFLAAPRSAAVSEISCK